MGSNSCFSKIIADVFPPWHLVNIQLNAPDQQTANTSAFIEVITLTDDELIKCTLRSTFLVLLVFFTLLLDFCLLFVKQ